MRFLLTSFLRLTDQCLQGLFLLWRCRNSEELSSSWFLAANKSISFRKSSFSVDVLTATSLHSTGFLRLINQRPLSIFLSGDAEIGMIFLLASFSLLEDQCPLGKLLW